MFSERTNEELIGKKTKLQATQVKMSCQIAACSGIDREGDYEKLEEISFQIAGIEWELAEREAFAEKLLNLQRFVQGAFSFLYECELSEDEIPF